MVSIGHDITNLPTRSVTLLMALVRSDNTTPAVLFTRLSSYRREEVGLIVSFGDGDIFGDVP